MSKNLRKNSSITVYLIFSLLQTFEKKVILFNVQHEISNNLENVTFNIF